MGLELRAEYGVYAGVRWHVVSTADPGLALCKALLSPIAQRRPITHLQLPGGRGDELCARCRAALEHGAGRGEARAPDTTAGPEAEHR